MAPRTSDELRRLLVLLAVVVLAVCLATPVVAAQSDATDAPQDDEAVAIASEDLEGAEFYGGTLAVENLTPFDDGTVELRRFGGDESELTGRVVVGEEATFTVDTANLAAQSYVVRDADGDHGPFHVYRQDVTVSGEDVVVGDGTASLVFEEDNRGAAVDLLVSTRSDGDDEFGHDLNATDLDAAVGGDAFETTVEDEDRLRVHDVREGDRVPVDVDAFDAEQGSFTVVVADSRAWDAATLPLREPDDANVELSTAVLQGAVVWSGQTLTVDDLAPFDDGTVEVRAGTAANSTLVRRVDLGDRDRLTIDTQFLEEGDYVVRDANGDWGAVDVLEQEIDTALVDHVAYDNTEHLVIRDDNRGETVDLLVESVGAVGAERFDDEFGGDRFETSIVDDETIRIHDVQASQEVPVDVTNYTVGKSTFRVQIADTGAQDAVVVSVGGEALPRIPIGELDRQRYWTGQDLTVTGFDSSETVAVRGPDETAERTASDGTVTFYTNTLAPGEYTVEGRSSGVRNTFEHQPVTFETLSFDGPDENGTSTLDVESNRVGYNVQLRGSDVDAHEFAAAFEDGLVRNGNFLLHVPASNHSFAFDRSELPAGTHSLAFLIDDLGHGELLRLEVEGETNESDPTDGRDRANESEPEPDETVAVEDLDDAVTDTVWRGQTVAITDLPGGSNVTVRGPDDEHRERRADENGTLTLEPVDWQTGTWTVRVDGDDVGTFELEEQTIDELDVHGFTTAHDRTLDVESNRRTYELALSSDDLDAETLAAAVDGASVDGDRALLEVSGLNSRYSIDASALPSGAHHLAATVVDTPASANATVTVESTTDTSVPLDDVDGRTVWLGQEFELTGLSPGTDVVFRGPDDAHRDRTADDDGTVTVQTDGWTAGEYVLESNGTAANATFDLHEQSVDVRLHDDPVPDSTLLSLDSNRSGYTVELSSDDLDAETLAENLYSGRLEGDRVLLDAHGRTVSTRLYVSDLPAGDYEITADVLDTPTNATVDLTVGAGVEVEGNHPMPYEGSKAYYDVNGDRSLTNSDVVEFFGFQHYHPAVENHSEGFDFDRDGDVGQSDVVELFEAVNGAPIETPDSQFVPGDDPERPEDGVAPGEVATVNLDVEHTDEAWIDVAQPWRDYRATVHLTDVDENETVALDVDTAAIGQGAPEEVFPSAENAEIESVRERGAPVLEAPTEFVLESYAADPTAFSADHARVLRVEPAASRSD